MTLLGFVRGALVVLTVAFGVAALLFFYDSIQHARDQQFCRAIYELILACVCIQFAGQIDDARSRERPSAAVTFERAASAARPLNK